MTIACFEERLRGPVRRVERAQVKTKQEAGDQMALHEIMEVKTVSHRTPQPDPEHQDLDRYGPRHSGHRSSKAATSRNNSGRPVDSPRRIKACRLPTQNPISQRVQTNGATFLPGALAKRFNLQSSPVFTDTPEQHELSNFTCVSANEESTSRLERANP